MSEYDRLKKQKDDIFSREKEKLLAPLAKQNLELEAKWLMTQDALTACENELKKCKEASGKSICTYCGFIGKKDPLRMLEHMATCEKHPSLKMMKKIVDIESKLAEYREALEWYAHESHWDENGVPGHAVCTPSSPNGPEEWDWEPDCGAIAERALKGSPK